MDVKVSGTHISPVYMCGTKKPVSSVPCKVWSWNKYA